MFRLDFQAVGVAVGEREVGDRDVLAVRDPQDVVAAADDVEASSAQDDLGRIVGRAANRHVFHTVEAEGPTDAIGAVGEQDDVSICGVADRPGEFVRCAHTDPPAALRQRQRRHVPRRDARQVGRRLGRQRSTCKGMKRHPGHERRAERARLPGDIVIRHGEAPQPVGVADRTMVGSMRDRRRRHAHTRQLASQNYRSPSGRCPMYGRSRPSARRPASPTRGRRGGRAGSAGAWAKGVGRFIPR